MFQVLVHASPVSESYSTTGLIVKLFSVAIRIENLHGAPPAAIQDGIDGELAGDVLHLTAAEIVCRCELRTLGRAEGSVWV